MPLLTPKMKYDYLKERFNLNLPIGRQTFKVECEFCQTEVTGKLNITKTGNVGELSLHNGMFHHKDGSAVNNDKENTLVLCNDCRKHFQYFGMVQRWLKENNCTLKDLPDCSGVPAIRRYFP